MEKQSIDTFQDDAGVPMPVDASSTSQQNKSNPSIVKVHSALITAQICFGLGGVISALGLPACNPFAFALYREVAAASILFVASSWSSSQSDNAPSILKEWKRFALLGGFLFGNQAGVIAGIKLAGPVSAAVWQPSQPIITAAICMLLGWEPPVPRRIVGVLISFLGCAVMVIMSGGDTSSVEARALGAGDLASVKDLVGHALFFFNCLCTALYVILSKRVLKTYPPMKVTAWSYGIASVIMFVFSSLISLSEETISFLCPDCTGTWNIPTGAILALAYAIVFNSVVAYALITWSNQYASGTLVIGYSVLQPVTAALLALVLVGIGLFPSCSDVADDEGIACLDPPNWGSFAGMIGVFTGLALVVMTETTSGSSEKEKYKYDRIQKAKESPVKGVELT